MKTIYWILLAIFIVIIGISIWYSWIVINDKNRNQDTVQQTETITKDNCIADECLITKEEVTYPVSILPQDVVDTLNKAIDDEYKARDTYNAVIDKLGSVKPFSQIVRAEEQHITSLKSLYDKYGIKIPDDTYIGKIIAPATLKDACALGVDAETKNIALYRDDLLPKTNNYPDIAQVFTSLMNASESKHLPAFQKCQ